MNFYILANPSVYETASYAVTDCLPVPPVNTGEAVQCPDCGSYLSMLPWLPPFRVQLEPWTDTYGDISFRGDELIVTNSFVEKYKRSKLNGLQVIGQVEVIRVKPRGGACPQLHPPSYWCARPILSQSKINLEESGVKTKGPVVCDSCRGGQILLRHDRVIVDEATWTGEDIFYARGLSGLIITSEPFAQWFRRSEFNTGVLIPAHEYAVDFYSSK